MAKTKGTYGMDCVYKRGNVLEGKFPDLRVERIKFDELAQDLINDYKVKGKKSLDRAERSVKRLKTFFEGMKAIDITTTMIDSYILIRQEEGLKNGTINRELSALSRMFNLAIQMTPPKVNHVPYIPRLKEATPRTGYFEHEEYIALRDSLPDHIKPVVIMAYYTGCRREEIVSLKWSQVNLIEKKITLNAGITKDDETRVIFMDNGEARVIFMDGELYEAVAFQKSLRDTHHPKCPWVFFNNEGEHIGRFDRSWKTACKKVKLEGRILHDFRRTAARNMVRAGVPERVAMMTSGHKTMCVFERYNIMNEDDLKKASRKVTQLHQKGYSSKMVTKTVTVQDEGGLEESVTIQ